MVYFSLLLALASVAGVAAQAPPTFDWSTYTATQSGGQVIPITWVQTASLSAFASSRCCLPTASNSSGRRRP